MSYPQRNRGGAERSVRRRRRRRLLTVISVIVLILLSEFVFPSFTRGVFTVILSPFSSITKGVSSFFSGASSVLASKADLMRENESIKRELLTHDALAARLAIFAEDNARMKALLGRASTTGMIVAAVLKRPPSSPYDTLVLDAGTRDGVKKDARVFAPGKVYIGSVTDMSGGTSVVTLLSSPDRKTDVVVGGSSIPGIAKGKGGGNFIIELPSEAGITEGDIIRAPGLSSELLGVVEKVVKDSTGSIQTIYFKNSYNFNNLDAVEIEK